MREVIKWLSIEACIAVAKDLHSAAQVEDIGITALGLLEFAIERVQGDVRYHVYTVQLDSEHGDMTRTLVIEKELRGSRE